MSNMFLFDSSILPKGFILPRNYIKFLQTIEGIDLEPWQFLAYSMGESLSYYGSMLMKHKTHPLVPFAIANDQSGLFNDGYVLLACFDGTDKSGDPKVYFYDYGYNGNIPDWNERYYLLNFEQWLKVAQEDSARYKTEQAESGDD